MKLKLVIICLIGAVGLLIVAGGLYLRRQTNILLSPNPTPAATENLGSQIFNKINNPLQDKLPETNPLKSQENPARQIYPNPFDRL